MPFKSDAQRAYLFIHHPDVAKEFAANTPKGIDLPQHVSDTKNEAMKRVLNKYKENKNASK